eukprot:3068091-Alexandrium_andersonii.AAC.1
MLGLREVPRLGAKAAETQNLLPLCVQLRRECPAALGRSGAFLKAACDEMTAFDATMERGPRAMSQPGLNALRHHTGRFLQFRRMFDGHFVAKHNFAWRLAERAAWLGNPKGLLDLRRRGGEPVHERSGKIPACWLDLLHNFPPEGFARGLLTTPLR